MEYLASLKDYIQNGPKHNGKMYSIYYLANSCDMYNEFVDTINTHFPNVIFVWNNSDIVEKKMTYYATKKYYTCRSVSNNFGNFLLCVTNQIRNKEIKETDNGLLLHIDQKILAFYYNYTYEDGSYYNFYPVLLNYNECTKMQEFIFPFSSTDKQNLNYNGRTFCVSENKNIKMVGYIYNLHQ